MNSKKIYGLLIASAIFAAFTVNASARQDNVSGGIKHDAKSAGHDIAHGAREVGHGTRHAARKIGHGAKDAGLGIGHGARKAGVAIGHGAREGWDASKSAVKQVFHKGN